MRLVVDASVAVKWIFPDPRREPQANRALDVLDDIRAQRVEVVQPVHWLAEVAAVAVRLAPGISREAVGLLYSMELPTLEEPEIYLTACQLADDLGHHLFDTLYHAVALAFPDGVLVTADERYYRKATGVGQVWRLRDYRMRAA
jgi:predicted nucleic acid-binding protein